jgi:multiple sugar transport system permease protein
LRRRRSLKAITSYAILVVWALVVGLPMYWLVISAFKTSNALFQEATFIPWVDFQPTLVGFRRLFISGGLLTSRPMINSLIVSLATASLSTLIGSAAGYALARFRFQIGLLNNSRIALAFLAQRMMPTVVLLVPFLMMYKVLDLLDTLVGLIVAYVALNVPLAVWIVRDFFAGIPPEIEECALIDGCGRIGVLIHVAIPLGAPGFITAFVLTMIAAWNEFPLALALMFNKAVTMPWFLATHGRGFGSMAIIALVSTLPVALVGLSLERYITQGLTSGGVK